MKKIIICICIFMIFSFSIASAETIKSISPKIEWEENFSSGGIGKIFFAEHIIKEFLGDDYQVCDNFNIKLKNNVGIVRFEFEHFHYDNDFLMIIFNSSIHYYCTPIIIDKYMLIDFTNIIKGQYEVYVIHNFN